MIKNIFRAVGIALCCAVGTYMCMAWTVDDPLSVAARVFFAILLFCILGWLFVLILNNS